jgi:hypothetical protein
VARHGAEMLDQFRRRTASTLASTCRRPVRDESLRSSSGSHAPSTGTAGPAPGGSPH